jgi:hypothetical protein
MPDVTITPSEDGPYQVSGPVFLTDVDGRQIPHPDPRAPTSPSTSTALSPTDG